MKIQTDITVIEKSVLVALIKNVIQQAIDPYHQPDQPALLEVISTELDRLKAMKLISYHEVTAFFDLKLANEEKDE